MGSTKNCMNEFCRAATSAEWKKGWSLKSGGVAILCTSCGSAYENSVFCETFHLEDSGWRECRVCGKLVHCGCIASKYLYEYMDFGGIGCSSCAKLLEIQSKQTLQIPSNVPNGNFIPRADVKDSSPLVVESKIDSDKFNTKTLLQLALEHHRLEEPLPSNLENSKSLPNVSEPSTPSGYVGTDSNKRKQVPKNIYESIAHSPLSFSLSTPSSTGLPFRDKVSEGSEQSKGSFKARHGFPKPPKPSLLSGSETSKGASSQARVPRPPAEGRGRNQLLPRYWPRITDQELQQLSGDLKSTIVPLFEKILSASDAGRIGRLVLPKACAEAYFPTINQSEGIPIKIQDVKGKEWTFQFRFWPNNNSRMYVLEGVTPCIQNMQLQAGDTVIFSQRDPGGQLVIGCRKATNNVEGQDSHSPAIPTGDPSSDQLVSLSADNLSNGAIAAEDAQRNTERKKSKNIKNKRLLMHNDDATELRITWEEAQELFRPASSAQPNVVIVDGYEFEEFQEPPVFGKRTIFISKPSGEQEQLAQCDSCHKWRRLPAYALLSANWTCSNNIWDLTRCSCSAVESINPKDLEFCGISNDNKKHRSSESNSKLVAEAELTGLDALATAAVLGDNIVDIGESSIGPTTRHPRHRPGCSCIVCIQPPSGKGKHEPTCKCNVCSTVRRRFKTLMMRKKKRQTEREAEKHNSGREDMALLNMNQEETKAGIKTMDSEEASKGQQLDLNSDPRHEDESLVGMSLTTLINAANLPMDVYLNEVPIPTSETGSSCPAPAAAIDAIKLPSSMEDVKHGNKQGES